VGRDHQEQADEADKVDCWITPHSRNALHNRFRLRIQSSRHSRAPAGGRMNRLCPLHGTPYDYTRLRADSIVRPGCRADQQGWRWQLLLACLAQ
jgi:hypothetical protein